MSFIKCGLLFALLSLILKSTHASPKDAQAPTYVFNLDLPPENRWDSILKDFDKHAYINNIDEMLRTFVDSQILMDIIAKLAGSLDRYFPAELAEEIRGISRAFDVELGYVVLANLVNDLHSYEGSPLKMCTSIVTMTKDGELIHGRNLDFAFSDFLRNYTIQLDCQRNGYTVYTASTFLTSVAFMTASKPNSFTISFDDRNTGHWWQNLIGFFEKSWPEIMFIREVLDKAQSFDEAIPMLKNVKTIASAYFIVGGTKPYEGAIVVGNRTSAKVVWMNSTLEHVWFLVETNYDPWNKPPPQDERRDPAIKYMKKWGLDRLDADHLYNVLSTPPVLNEDTISTTIMSAVNSSMYKTIVRYL